MKRICLATILIFSIATAIDDGGPINPTYAPSQGSYATIRPKTDGMSLRDYFAGQFLAGIASRGITSSEMPHEVDLAYRYADEMIKRRQR